MLFTVVAKLADKIRMDKDLKINRCILDKTKPNINEMS